MAWTRLSLELTALSGSLSTTRRLPILEIPVSARQLNGRLAPSSRRYSGLTKIPVDEDAMNEIGWCYLEGFGCKKDKVS